MTSPAASDGVPQVRLFQLSGDLDFFAAASMRETLDQVDGPCVIEMSGVRLISAAALTELVRVAHRVGPHQVTLSHPQRVVKKVFDLFEFDKLFIIEGR